MVKTAMATLTGSHYPTLSRVALPPSVAHCGICVRQSNADKLKSKTVVVVKFLDSAGVSK